MTKLTHVSSSGEARMVDVGEKGDTEREAVAKGRVTMKPSTLEQIKAIGLKKGDVLAVARIAGSGPGRVSPLSHKARYNTMEDGAIIEPLTGQKDKVVHCYRNIAGE